jgi:hypothetical protein
MLLRGKIPAGVEDSGVEVELEAAAVGDDPPSPRSATPGVIASGVAYGLEVLVVDPPVKIPPGPKVIPLAAGVEGDAGVAAKTMSGVAGVGETTTKGTVPLEAAEEAEVNGSG